MKSINLIQDAKRWPEDSIGSGDNLIEDCLLMIFNYLNHVNPTRLLPTKLVNKKWLILSSKVVVGSLKVQGVDWQLKNSIGPQHWAKLIGEDAPNLEEVIKAYAILPNNISEILQKPCRAFYNRVVGDSHTLVYIPKMIGKREFKLTTLRSMAMDSPNSKERYITFSLEVIPHLDKPVNKPYWVLMTNTVLHDSRRRPFQEQQEIVQELAEASCMPYVVPKILEAVAVNIACFLKFERYHFETTTMTRCEEKSIIEKTPISVGEYCRNNFFVTPNSFNSKCFGVAPLQRFGY